MSRELSLSIVIEAESISIPIEIELIETPVSGEQGQKSWSECTGFSTIGSN
jgi:hypothetical protein